CDSTDLAIHSAKLLGNGVVDHYYLIHGVHINFEVRDTWGSTSSSRPEAGDVGVINYYADNTDAQGNYVGGPDGIVDFIETTQLQHWTPEEEALLELAEEYTGVLKEQGLFLMD